MVVLPNGHHILRVPVNTFLRGAELAPSHRSDNPQQAGEIACRARGHQAEKNHTEEGRGHRRRGQGGENREHTNRGATPV